MLVVRSSSSEAGQGESSTWKQMHICNKIISSTQFPMLQYDRFDNCKPVKTSNVPTFAFYNQRFPFLFFEFALVLSSHSPVSNTIQLCASDNERRTRALLTFPKYPASGEAKASKPVSSPVIGKQLLRLFGSMAVRCHPQYITMSPQTLSPPSTLRKKKKTGMLWSYQGTSCFESSFVPFNKFGCVAKKKKKKKRSLYIS